MTKKKSTTTPRERYHTKRPWMKEKMKIQSDCDIKRSYPRKLTSLNEGKITLRGGPRKTSLREKGRGRTKPIRMSKKRIAVIEESSKITDKVTKVLDRENILYTSLQRAELFNLIGNNDGKFKPIFLVKLGIIKNIPYRLRKKLAGIDDA